MHFVPNCHVSLQTYTHVCRMLNHPPVLCSSAAPIPHQQYPVSLRFHDSEGAGIDQSVMTASYHGGKREWCCLSYADDVRGGLLHGGKG